ncbi:MAG TPA: NAD(P)-binding domain-containing protein [Acidimicrobiales bacterium]|nr:NAD(P)-binding domain-containing protein [Acidimicrobiales bacterium]
MTSTIAIIGAGSVGTALATGIARLGRDVVVGVREPGDPKHDHLRPTLTLRHPHVAARLASVVVLAVPVDGLADAVPALGLAPGQVLVDATNAVRSPVPAGFDTVGAFTASLAPAGVAVVKAFNTIGAEHLGDGRLGDAAAFLPIAGDEAGRPVVSELATALGFDVADLGGPESVAMVEDHARLWIHLALRRGWGRGLGFVAVR